MKPEEAIKTIKIALAEVEWDYPMDYTVAFEEAIEALEKQIPKKPKHIYETIPECPVCGLAVQYPFPCRCGQMIDYREDNNEDT